MGDLEPHAPVTPPSMPVQFPGAPRGPEPLPPSPPLRSGEWLALIFGSMVWAVGFSFWTLLAPSQQPVLTSVVLWSLSLGGIVAALFSGWVVIAGVKAGLIDVVAARGPKGTGKTPAETDANL